MRTVPRLDNPVHHPDVLGESAAGGLEAGRAADFLVGLALGKHFMPAVVTLAARDVMEHDHAIARPELAHSRAHRATTPAVS